MAKYIEMQNNDSHVVTFIHKYNIQIQYTDKQNKNETWTFHRKYKKSELLILSVTDHIQTDSWLV